MHRNLDRRVEVILPVIDAEIRSYITDEILGGYLRDTQNARLLKPDGTYRKVTAGEPFDVQMAFVGSDILA